jgi:hypothetical protein
MAQCELRKIGNDVSVKYNLGLASATLLLASAVLSASPAGAQVAMSSTEQVVRLRSALSHFDRETHALATMTNQIPSSEVVPIPVAGLQIGVPGRRALLRATSPSRHAALQAALGKATVADVNRDNGQSPDQSSLAEYLQRLGIDPNKVVAVEIDSRRDRQNPRVSVFYQR